MRRFDVLLGIDQPPAGFARQPHLRFGQNVAPLGRLVVQLQQQLVTHLQARAAARHYAPRDFCGRECGVLH
jgi:hypothetical protein